MAAATSLSAGQSQWTTPGTYSFQVPAGVFRLSGVVIGGAGDSTGSGGANHWRNSIPVVPGETLSIQVGSNDRFAGLPIESYVKRGAVYLLRATHSSFFGTLGGGGGNGGSGSINSASAGGGGAGGYVGNGGSGSGSGNPPAANSGGGQGGSPNSDGQGVGLQGRTPDFAPGSLGTPKCGGGIGEGQNGGPGGVRLMWGPGRSYPDAAADV